MTVKTSLAALAAVLVLALAPAGAAYADDDDRPLRTISLNASGEVAAPPDMATVMAGVVTEGPDAQTALRGNTAAVQAMFSALAEAGIEGRDMQTRSFDVSPSYTRPERGQPPEISGYRVTNSVAVRVRDIAKLGTLLDRVVSAGANQMNGVRFEIDEPEKLMDEARRKAVAEARRKAELYATAAGVEIKRVISIAESGAAPPQPMLRTMVRDAAAESVPVAAGEQTVRASVTVTYELE